MDELKDKEVSDTTIFESSKETVSDQVASEDSEKIRVVEPVGSEVQAEGQGATKGVVAEEGGSCNRMDIMVGIMGSDIYVDGVRIRDFGGGSGGNLSEEVTSTCGGSKEVGSERDMNNGDVSGSKATVDSGVEASNLRAKSEVRMTSVAAESKVEEKLLQGSDGDSVSKKTMDLGTGVSDLGTENEVGTSSGVAQSKEEEKLGEDSDVVAGDSGSKAAVDSSVETSSMETENEVGKSSGFEESKEEEELEDEHGVAGDSGSKAPMGTDVESSGLETENEVRNSSAVAESKEEEKLVSDGVRSRDVSDAGENDLFDDKTSQEVGIGNDQKMEIGCAVEGSSLIENSSGGEIQVVAEKVAVTKGEESVEGGSGKECVGRGGIDAIDDVSSQEVGVSEHGAHYQIVEGGGSSAVVGSSEDETKVVVVEKSELVEKAMDQANETNGSGGEELRDSEVQVGVLHDEVWNPGIETTGAPSSTIIEDSNVGTKIVEEEDVVMANDENLNSKVEATLEGTHSVDAMEGVLPSSEKVSFSTEKDPIANVTYKSFDEQTQVVVDGTVASMDSEEITCTNIEGMDTDAFNENFCFSVEELQATFETANGSTENHYDACADMQSSQQPTQVVGGEVAATNNKVLLHSEDGKKLLIEECSDWSIPHDSAQGHANVEPDTQEEQGKVQTTNDSTENPSNVGLDPATSCQSAQVVDNKVHSNPNFEGPIHVPVDGMLASSGNDQHIKPWTEPMEIDTQIAIVSEPAEKDQKLKMKECLGKSVSDTAQVDSDIGQVMDAQEQVAYVEELGEGDRKVAKQNTKAEAVCTSTETDTLVMDGGQTAIANNDVTSNPNTGLDGPGEGDQHIKLDEGLDESADLDISEIESNVGNETAVEEHVSDFEHVFYDEKANIQLVPPSSGKKRKGSDPFADDSVPLEGRKTFSLAKVSTTAPSLPKPSFKIGECIRRVASQMTGSPSILKANSQKQDGSYDGLVLDGSDISFQHSEDAEMRKMTVPKEYSSLDELLSQLYLAARDPSKGYSFLTIIISFFSNFRNSVIKEQHDKVGGKRRHSIGGSETFEFEDMSDTYWTDRVIQNGSEEQPSRKSRKRDNLFVPVELSKPVKRDNLFMPVELSKPVNKSNTGKRYSDDNYGQSPEKPAGYVDENAAAELVMHFPVVDSVPSEISLNKMFRRFGRLKESETEVDKDTNRARVVFKKCSDAEAAYGSAPKFNIFGSMLVNYQLNYTLSVPFKTQPVATVQDEDATFFLQY